LTVFVYLYCQHVNHVSAFNDQSKRVKKQALLEVNIGGIKLDQVVLLSAQLLTEAILGLDFLINYETEINFPEWRIKFRVHEEVFDFVFANAKETLANRVCDLGRMSVLPQTKQLLIKVIATQRIPPQWLQMSQCWIRIGKMVRVWKAASTY